MAAWLELGGGISVTMCNPRIDNVRGTSFYAMFRRRLLCGRRVKLIKTTQYQTEATAGRLMKL